MIDPRTVADALINAELERRPISPFSSAFPFFDAETAYKAQRLFVERRLQSGEHTIGHKLGMTSRVRRDALGIQQPVHGVLTSGMVLAPGGPLPLDELIHPVAEPELAFLIGRPLAGPTTMAGVLHATDAVLAAIEIADTRYRAPFRQPDSIADNVAASRFALGTRARPPAELEDLRLIGCIFRRRGEVVGTAAAGAAMGHPAAGVVWLVDQLAERNEELPAGSLVLSGGLTSTVPMYAGTSVTAEFDGLGAISLHGAVKGVSCPKRAGPA